MGEKTLRENGTNMIGGAICVNKWQFYMLKKIIKTHTARLDFVDIIKPAFLRNAVATNRQRRVIASSEILKRNYFIPPQFQE